MTNTHVKKQFIIIMDWIRHFYLKSIIKTFSFGLMQPVDRRKFNSPTLNCPATSKVCAVSFSELNNFNTHIYINTAQK